MMQRRSVSSTAAEGSINWRGMVATIPNPRAHRLDHDDFGLNQSKIINVINSKHLERVAGGKPLRTFPQPALRAKPGRGPAVLTGLARQAADRCIRIWGQGRQSPLDRVGVVALVWTGVFLTAAVVLDYSLN